MDRRYLSWRAGDSLAEIEAVMARGEAVEVALPQGTHHALYMHCTPGARSSEGSTLEARGGAELLHAMSGVAGLEELMRLEEPARRAGYSVLLRGPDPTLMLLPPEEHPVWISMECRRRHGSEAEPYEFRVGGHRLHVLRVLERGGDARLERLTLLVADGRRFVVEHDRGRSAWYLHRVMPAERSTERSHS